MNNIWIFRNGVQSIECTSFPFAYRSMWYALKKNAEAGKSNSEMIKHLSIISPVKDRYGQKKVYDYDQATTMATNQGLLGTDGQINSREFKRK